MKTKHPQIHISAVSIAGFDPSTGAGVTADIRTFSNFGIHSAGVITSITSQNSMGVQAIRQVDPNTVLSQLESLFSDLNIKAVKIGMLGSAPVAKAVSRFLTDLHPRIPIVCDPVLKSTGGVELLDRRAFDTLKNGILPLCTIVTPNLEEAEFLCGFPVKKTEDMKKAAIIISHFGPKSVLVKGGHLKGGSTDVLFCDGKFTLLVGKRFSWSGHGSGCRLSSAIASGLAKNETICLAVKNAKNYIGLLFEKGPCRPGSGSDFFKD